MKKITYILSLLTAISLIGCGNAASFDAPAVEAALSEEMEDTDIADEAPPSSSDYDGENLQEESEAINARGSDESDETAKEADSNSDIGENIQESENGSESILSEYTVTSFEENKTMYASSPVNVRQGPSTDFERVGFLGLGQEVSVTGQADTEWYEIIYGEDKAFVSNKYLQDEVPTIETAEEPAPDSETASSSENPSQETETPQPVIEVKNVAGVILVGDSRFVQMQNSVGENSCTWIAESGKGYNWFNEKAIPRIDSCVGKGSKILINLGVNDTGNLQKYISLVNAKADEWAGKGATVYYASVNPVWENPYVNEEQVEYFNSQMQSSLNGNVHWIDSHSYLTSVGYKLVDGLHYSAETYQNIYAYYMSCL